MIKNNVYLPNVTFFRFIAALWIVFFHFGTTATTNINNPIITRVVSNGFQAVSFFYVLSGFIMAYLYYSSFLDNQFQLFKFWKARFARIYPAYFVALLFCFLFYLYWGTDLRLVDSIVELLCLQTWKCSSFPGYNYPDWSISVEFFFYLIFPFVIKKFVFLSTKLIALIVLVFWFTTQYLYNVIDLDSQKIFEDFPLFHVSSFIFGVFGGVLFFRYNSFLINLNFVKIFSTLIAISGILFTCHFLFGVKENIGFYSPVFLLLIFVFVLDRTYFSVLFANRFADYLGEISYSIYIFQYPVYILAKIFANKLHINVDSLFFLFSFVCLLIGVSMLTHKFIEKKIRKLILERL